MTATLEPLFRSWATASIHGALLVVIILGIQWLAGRRISPRWKHALWIVLLIRLGIPSLPESPISPLNLTPPTITWKAEANLKSHGPSPKNSLSSPGQIDTALSPTENNQAAVSKAEITPAPPNLNPLPSSPNPPQMPQLSMSLMSALWLIVGIGMFLRLSIQSWIFTQKVAHTTVPTHPRIQQAFETACARLKIETANVGISTTPTVHAPCLFGLLQPRLLLPLGLPNRLSQEELEWVCLHELAHHKRHDILFSWIESILQCVHWFNPIVWFGFKRLKADRELATDDLVLRSADSTPTTGYGETIVKLLEGINQAQSPKVGAIGITEKHTRIKQRIHAIAVFSPKRQYSIVATLGSLTLALLFILEGQSKPAQTPTEGFQIQAHLREHQTHIPISNATVRVTVLNQDNGTEDSSRQERETFVFQSAEDGSINLSNLPSEVESMTIVIEHPDFLTVHRSLGQINQTQIPPEIQLEMIRPVTIGGTVTTSLQRPIKGASIYPYFTQPEGGYFEKYYIPRAKTPAITDENGRWTARSVPAGSPNIDIYVTHPDYAVTPRIEQSGNNQQARFYRQQRGTMESFQEGSFTTIMKRGTRLRGTIRHHGDQPVPNATIGILWAHSPPIVTDERGEFEVPIALTGPVNLRISAPGFSPFEATENIVPSMAPVSYDLQSGHSLTIQFIDDMGQPIEKVAVTPNKWSYIYHATRDGNQLSDAQGLWTWNDAPNEELSFYFHKDGYRRMNKPILRPQPQPHVVQMERALEVLFTITDTRGRPIENVRLYRSAGRATRPTGIPSFLWERIDPVQIPDLANAGVGAPVSFKVFESEPPTHGTLNEKIYITYRAEAPGFRSALSAPVDVSEQQVTLAIQLQKSPTGPRQLLRPNGDPLSNQDLWLLAPDHTYRVHESMLFVEHRDNDLVRTDHEGFFELPFRDQPFWVLGLMEEGFLLVPDDTATPFVVQPWATLQGTWTEGGQPGKGVELGVKLGKPFLAFSKRVPLDGNGSFHFSRVPPGEIEVVADLSVGSSITYHRSIDTLQLAPGRAETLDITLPHSRAVTGRIMISETLRPRVPINTVALLMHHESPQDQALYGQLPWIIHIDDEGYFLTPRLLAGQYTTEIRMAEFRTPHRSPLVPNVFATAAPQFTIDSSSPETIDLGTIEVEETKP